MPSLNDHNPFTPSLSAIELVHRLAAELTAVRACATPGFTGLGVLVWDGLTSLPFCALADGQPIFQGGTLATQLAALGEELCPVHDGFHILSKDLDLIACGMYFSPPIVPRVTWDRTRGYGGRYVAALFGSCLPGILAAGVLSTSYGAVTFVKGVAV